MGDLGWGKGAMGMQGVGKDRLPYFIQDRGTGREGAHHPSFEGLSSACQLSLADPLGQRWRTLG